MAEDLVPTGQPYGSRQATVAAMQEAGLPTQSSPAMGSSPAPGGGGPTRPPVALPEGLPGPLRAARGDFDPLLEGTPDEFPYAQQALPATPTGDPPASIRMRRIAATSQNRFVRDMAKRLVEGAPRRSR